MFEILDFNDHLNEFVLLADAFISAEHYLYISWCLACCKISWRGLIWLSSFVFLIAILKRLSFLIGLILWRLECSRNFLQMISIGTTSELVYHSLSLFLYTPPFKKPYWSYFALQLPWQGKSIWGGVLASVLFRGSMEEARGMAVGLAISARVAALLPVTSCSNCRIWKSLILIPRGEYLFVFLLIFSFISWEIFLTSHATLGSL